MKTILTLIALMICGYAYGACTTVVSWTPPITNTDGSALVKCASQTSTGPCLRTFNIYYGKQPAALTQIMSVNDRNATSYTFPSLANGPWYFGTTAINGDLTESVMSNIATKTCLAPPVPTPPTNPTVTMTVTVTNVKAFKIRFSVDGMDLVQIGKVAVGTVCDTRHNVDGYSIVPRDAVTMLSSVDPKPTTVYAQCY